MSGSIGDNVFRASGVIAAAAAGRTGTVDWDTTPKTATFSAATAEGYFCNTTAGVLTVNLPAGAAGSIVSLADYAATWQTNNLTVSPNGTDKIGSVNSAVDLNTEGQSVTFVYVDSTQGWVNTMDSTSNVRGVTPFIHATGGTITCCGDYKIHSFTGPGTFCVSSISPSAPENASDWTVVAGGGGGGGGNRGAGGGGGGYRESPGASTGCYTVSPLGAAPSAAVTVSIQGYSITVGGGGPGGDGSPSTAGTNGSASTFECYTSAGGGFGNNDGTGGGGPGGSGGGGSGCGVGGGTGNTPPTNPAQGLNGGAGSGGPFYGSGGGGGALVAGVAGTGPAGGAGGGGATTCITGSPVARAGGGGGARYTPGGSSGAGGAGGGGAAGIPGGPGGVDGGTNLGGGGGGGFCTPYNCGGAGGSGTVIIRYKFQ